MTTETREFTVPVKFVLQKGLGGGFRQSWITANNDERKIEAGIDSGAGLGNPYFTFWVEENGGKRIYFNADVRDILREALGKVEPVEVLK